MTIRRKALQVAKANRYRAAGVVFLVLLSWSLFGYSPTKEQPKEVAVYKSYFTDAFGLSEGAPVRVAGIAVGSIVQMDYNRTNQLVEIIFSVDRDYALPEDTLVEIRTDNFFSGKHLLLVPGWEAVEANSGDTLESRNNGIDFFHLLADYFR